ncbi:hypothetical protein EDC01DRAFT_651202 [Geopyxis carbonaria]|nr:hypothetical protein EDC01DRAFT_651202 [Geopyxis carbonaria]
MRTMCLGFRFPFVSRRQHKLELPLGAADASPTPTPLQLEPVSLPPPPMTMSPPSPSPRPRPSTSSSSSSSIDPAVATALSAFTSLPLPQRHAFLTALAPTLTHSDWFQLASHFTRRSSSGWGYHFDVLPALPFELSLQVLSYLPPLTAIRLRRVSKLWNALLTTPAICRGLTPPELVYHPPPTSITSTTAGDTPTPTSSTPTDLSPDRRRLENLLSLSHALTHARPRSLLAAPLLTAQGSRIAWSLDNLTFSVHDLSTQTLLVSNAPALPARQRIATLALLADYIVFSSYTSERSVYIRPLATPSVVRTVHLPSPDIDLRPLGPASNQVRLTYRGPRYVVHDAEFGVTEEVDAEPGTGAGAGAGAGAMARWRNEAGWDRAARLDNTPGYKDWKWEVPGEREYRIVDGVDVANGTRERRFVCLAFGGVHDGAPEVGVGGSDAWRAARGLRCRETGEGEWVYDSSGMGA